MASCPGILTDVHDVHLRAVHVYAISDEILSLSNSNAGDAGNVPLCDLSAYSMSIKYSSRSQRYPFLDSCYDLF